VTVVVELALEPRGKEGFGSSTHPLAAVAGVIRDSEKLDFHPEKLRPQTICFEGGAMD
jgi:hypothetical protein